MSDAEACAGDCNEYDRRGACSTVIPTHDRDAVAIAFVPWSGTSVAAILLDASGKSCRRKIVGIGIKRVIALEDLIDQCKRYAEPEAMRIACDLLAAGNAALAAAPWREWPMGIDPNFIRTSVHKTQRSK